MTLFTVKNPDKFISYLMMFGGTTMAFAWVFQGKMTPTENDLTFAAGALVFLLGARLFMDYEKESLDESVNGS